MRSSVLGRAEDHRPRSALRRLRARLAPGMSRREVAIRTRPAGGHRTVCPAAPARPSQRPGVSGTLLRHGRGDRGRSRRPVRVDHPPRQGVLQPARRDEARSRRVLPRRRGAADGDGPAPSGAPGALSGGRRREVVLPEAGAEVGARLAHHHRRLHPQRHHQRRPRGRGPRPPAVGREPGVPRLPRVAQPAARPRGGRRAAHRPRPVAGHRVRAAPGGGRARARAARASSGIDAYIKTSGSRGLHLYVALEPRWDSYEVRAAAVALARELERRHPDQITAAWWKEERGSRVFVDFNQNAPHKTVFGAWCARPRVGAQVSTPITWDELADRGARRAHHRDGAGAPRRARRRVGGHVRPPPGPHAAARAVRPRPAPTGSWTRRGRPCTRRCRTSRRGSLRAAPAQLDPRVKIALCCSARSSQR